MYRLFPEIPLQVSSLEEQYTDSFKPLVLFERVTAFFSLLIVSLAVLGFATYSVFYFQNREKEVVLRFLMGARKWDFIKLLIRNIFPYFLVSLVLSSAIGWGIVHFFFRYFYFTTAFPYWVFIGVPLLLLVLFFGISYLALIRLLKRPPASVLRYE